MQGPVALVPFFYVKHGDPANPKIEAVLVIYMQFDKPGISGHRNLDMTNYSDAKMELIPGVLPACNLLVPLILAHKHQPDDIRIETEFAGGKLWGWFPKGCAA